MAGDWAPELGGDAAPKATRGSVRASASPVVRSAVSGVITS